MNANQEISYSYVLCKEEVDDDENVLQLEEEEEKKKELVASIRQAPREVTCIAGVAGIKVQRLLQGLHKKHVIFNLK